MKRIFQTKLGSILWLLVSSAGAILTWMAFKAVVISAIVFAVIFSFILDE